MASRRDRLTGNTSPTPAPTAKRPKRKPSSTKPRKSRSNGGTTTPKQPTNTSVGYFDESTIGTSAGVYDPNATYGRTPTNTDIGTFNEWLANNGYTNKKNLNKNKKANLQQQYTTAKGPEGEFATTDAGAQVSNENPDQYWNWTMGEAGGLTPGFSDTAFGAYLNGKYKTDVMGGFDAANMQSGGNLNFRDYMSSIGWAPNQQQNTLLGAAPHDTGNPFTSTSLPQPTTVNQSYNNVRDYAQAQGVNGWQGLNRHRRNSLKDAYSANENAYTASMTNPATPPAAPALPDIPGVDGLASARKAFNRLTPQQRGINGSTANRSGRWAVYG